MISLYLIWIPAFLYSNCKFTNQNEYIYIYAYKQIIESVTS